MNKFLVLISALLIATSSTIAVAEEYAATNKPITFSIVPQQSASRLAKLWLPIMAHISKETGLTIQFRTAKDIPTFEERVKKGEYDISYMNPYHYTVFHETTGYQAFAKARDKKIKGILVKSKDGGINEISQLNGSTLAFPAPAAFAASILTRAYLQNEGIEFTPKYVSSHDSVYRSVATGLYPAGGGVIRTLNNMPPEISDKLEVLWTSPGYTPHAFAAHPDLDKDKVAAIQKAMLEMENTEAGQAMLQSIKLKGIEAAVDTDWDDVRGLNIGLLFEKEKTEQ